MLASEIFGLVSFELNDASAVRWDGAELIRVLNDAERAVVLARPDANAVTESVKLVAGTKQAVPTGAFRLLDATRNMGTAGTTAGAAINFSDRRSQDLFNPGWHTDTAVSTVSEVFYDAERDPLIFYVSAPIAATPDCYIEVASAKAPTKITASSDSITLVDVYVPAIEEWMLWRAYMVNTQSQASMARAQVHLSAFNALLGIKTQADKAVKPEGDRP